VTASCFVLEAYDPPLESTFSPQSILAQEIILNPNETDVLIVGAHESAGRMATILAAAEFNDSGVKSYTVRLQPDNRQIIVELANLVRRLVAELNYELT
jgi:hypothetical protein